MHNKLVALVAVLLSVSMLSACETVKGFGKDLQKVGDKIENSAKK